MHNRQNEKYVHDAVKNGELEIDNEGRVWRLRQRRWNRWLNATESLPCQRRRAETKNKQGYLQVRVMQSKKRAYAAAHRLVWFHLHGAIPDGITINHKDGNKENNRPCNLELATMSEQRIHALEVLNVKRNRPQGSKHPKTKLTEEDVLVIRARREAGEMVKDIASSYGMRPKAITAIVTRRTWKHI